MEYDPSEGYLPAPVTPAEMSAALKKMSAKNTASGPDGVPGKVISLALTVLGEKLAEMFNKCLCEGSAKMLEDVQAGAAAKTRRTGRYAY